MRQKISSLFSAGLRAAFVLLLVMLSVGSFATIRYVRAGGAGNGSGSSWANASGSLQAMINASGNGDEVWVAGGTYRPTTDGNREMSFAMKAGVKIYGSFAGNETSLAQRNLWVRAANPAILSGDLGNNDLVEGSALGTPGLNFANNSDNSYHVINNNSNGLTTANSLLDGFIISGGNATGTGANQQSGGGMYNLNSSPALANIIFRWNNANAGGGLFNSSSSPVIENAIFFQNTAANGAGIVIDLNSTVNLFNNLFSDNRVSANGGAMFIAQSSSINIFNTTFTRNYSPATGAVLVNSGSSATVKNSIVWGNLNGNTNAALGSFIGNVETVVSITYSIVEGGWTGTGNTSNNPQFANTASPAGADGIFMTADDGLRPDFCNAAYNSGDNSGVSTTDILGNNRLYGTVDLGPYELQQPINAATNWYSDPDGDGYYAGSPIFTCSSPGPGFTTTIIAGGDFNNTNSSVNPGATEVCNGVDDNCNGQVDEGTTFAPAIIAEGNLSFCSTGNVTLSASWGNNALQLNGTNQYFITPDLTAYFPTKSFSVELWFKANADGVIVTNLGSAAVNAGWHASLLELSPNGRLYARAWDLAAVDLGAVTPGTWNHAVVRYDAATNTLDGALNGNVNSGKTIGDRQASPAMYLAFGAGESTNLGSGKYFNGQIDEVRIWKTAISNDQINQTYKKTIAGNAAGLVAYYKLDGTIGVSGEIMDAGTHAATASAVNGPQVIAATGATLNEPGYQWSNNTSMPSINLSSGGSFTVLTTISANCKASTPPFKVGYDSILYVDSSKPAGGNGNSWRSAFNSLQDALAATNTYSCINQIWVAKGTYKPTTGTDRAIAFTMKNGIAIYGGFAGTETALSQRDLTVTANASILSGDLNGDDVIAGSGNTLNITNNGENSYNVVYNLFTSGSPLNASAILDGFTITGGSNRVFADGPNRTGGGMYNFEASPTLRNLVFTGNYAYLGGGGMANQSNSSPVMVNITFDRNIAQRSGGGMYNYNNGINLHGLTFTGNLSFGNDGGGALYDYGGVAQISNCVFENNTGSNGGAISFNYSTYSIRSTVFSKNSSFQNGGGIFGNNSDLKVFSSLFTGQKAGWEGGALYRNQGSMQVSNATITGNTSGTSAFTPSSYAQSGVLYQDGSMTEFSNSIIWNNASLFTGIPGLFRCIVQGGFGGAWDFDPQFQNEALPVGADGRWNTSDDGLKLRTCSGGLNTGENLGVTGTDLLGNPRIYNGVVDLGAYELQMLPQPLVPVSPETTNNALRFDGVDDNVALINSCGEGAPLINGGDEITIEYWFQGSVLQSAVRLQPDGDNYIVSGHYGEHILSNDGGWATGSGVPVGAAATDGNWHHIAMTWKRGAHLGFRSYLDGKLVHARAASANPLPVISTGAYLGALYGHLQMMTGSLDNVRIWSVARTEEQIQAGICGDPVVGEPGLVAWYTFDHGEANGNNIAVVPGIENKAQPGYFPGKMSGFALTGNSSNWVTAPGRNVTRLYVKRNSDIPTPGDTYDGLSWATAFRELRDALKYPCLGPNLEIWVAAGTYKPTAGTDRYASFKMPYGVAIYGGFAGNETELGQRNIAANVTVLSGDLTDDDEVTGYGSSLTINNATNNSYHVFYNEYYNAAQKLDSTAILDGFTITGGGANTPIDGYDYGGAMYNILASPTLRNLVFSGNYSYSGGSAIFNGLNSSPQLTDVLFTQNYSLGDGAGIFNYTGANVKLNRVSFKGNRSGITGIGGVLSNYQNNFSLTNCIFSDNYSPDGGAIGNLEARGTIRQSSFINNEANWYGGVMMNWNATVDISNSLFSGNLVAYYGGVISNGLSSTVNISNSTIYNNRAGRPGIFSGPDVLASSVLYAVDASPTTITNSIIWGNASTFYNTVPTITYSTIQGGYSGTGNSGDDPRFESPSNVYGADNAPGTADDGLRLKPCSPALNAGDNASASGQDLTGNARIFNSTVDMGAYELQQTPAGTLTLQYQDADGDGFGNPAVSITDCSLLPGYVIDNTDCNDSDSLQKPGQVWYKDTDNDGYAETGAASITQCARPAGYKIATELTAITGDCNDNNAGAITVMGNPSVFGSNVWNVYAWNAGGASLSGGTSWNTNYSGYYTDNNLGFNSQAFWVNTPSDASTYLGCPVAGDNHSFSAKRKGFPAGEYQLDVPEMDDAAELWINGAKVWSFEGCCQPQGNVWTGNLGPDDEVEFRVTESTGNSIGKLNLTLAANARMYVKQVATGTGDGSSWANATSDLQGAINNPYGLMQVWVAAGTYKPTAGSNRGVSFTLKNGVTVLGGFAGTETSPGQRNWNNNPTILSGDIGTLNNAGDNSYHVIANNGQNQSAVLDGFTIRDGNDGGGSGGGLFNYQASPRILNCTFIANQGYYGGGISNQFNSFPVLINCVFTGNYGAIGGAVYNYNNTSPTLINCTITGNTAGFTSYGGGVYNAAATSTLINCIVWGNNSEISGDGSTVSNSIVRGGYAGSGNLNANPLFVSSTDFRLQSCSPAIDAGNDAQNGIGFDAGAQPRKVDARTGGAQIDMGAYEFQSVLTVYYRDADTDGYGDAGNTTYACTLPAGYVTNSGDCNDGNAAINPAATEVCDGVDNDCDGSIDEGFTTTTWYTDADGDSYGTGTGQVFCTNPGTGWANRGGDCNDGNAAINPGAAEICSNGIDDDCDGSVDEGCIITWYRDRDADGFGNKAVTIVSATKPAGYVADNTDCSDANKDIYPGAPELPDGKDNDCDGVIDDGLACRIKWYEDFDGDGFGVSSKIRWSCVKPTGFADKLGDCRDTDATVNPGATEITDGKDNDCDGLIDESNTACMVTWYKDQDGDGYGKNNWTKMSCTKPAGFVNRGGDCIDTDPTVYPGAPEICDGKDNDCNGRKDDNCTLITSAENKKPETATQSLAKEEELAEGLLEVRLWPNPAKDVLTVTLDAFVPGQKLEMVLMNAQGRLLKAESLVPAIKGQQVRFDVRTFASGFYLMHIKQGMLTETKKVIIAR